MKISSGTRTDLTFLRRRTKPGLAPASASGAAPAVEPSVPSSSAGLRLGPSAPVSQASSQTASRDNPVSAPQSSPSLTLRPSAQPTSQASAPARIQSQSPSAPVSVRGESTGVSNPGVSNPGASTTARAQKFAAQRQRATLEDHEVQLLFAAPGIRDVFELNLSNRVLRLSPLQSAVGTLLVSGSTAVAWESRRHVTGAQTVDGHKAGTPVMTAGNRALVGYQGRDALVTLRHVRELRRALFINRSSTAMGVRLISGDTVALPPPTDGTQMVLLLHRIGNVLELRSEPVPHDWSDQQIWQEFDFSMTHKAASSSYGR